MQVQFSLYCFAPVLQLVCTERLPGRVTPGPGCRFVSGFESGRWQPALLVVLKDGSRQPLHALNKVYEPTPRFAARNWEA